MKPSIFNVTRLLTMALILASVTLLLSNCARGKDRTQNALYGELQLSEGKCLEVAIVEYTGTQILYNNCESKVVTTGRGEQAGTTIRTDCGDEIQMHSYSGLTKVEGPKDSKWYYLPVTVYSYAPITESEYPKVDVEGETHTQAVAEARITISCYKSYYGSDGNYVLINLPIDQTPRVGANTP